MGWLWPNVWKYVPSQLPSCVHRLPAAPSPTLLLPLSSTVSAFQGTWLPPGHGVMEDDRHTLNVMAAAFPQTENLSAPQKQPRPYHSLWLVGLRGDYSPLNDWGAGPNKASWNLYFSFTRQWKTSLTYLLFISPDIFFSNANPQRPVSLTMPHPHPGRDQKGCRLAWGMLPPAFVWLQENQEPV